MSNSYGTDVSSGSGAEPQGTVETAKHEAVELKDTATEQAKDVVGTAKNEAASVIGEAKSQVKDLYGQSQQELKEQAATQQQRIADGLRSVSDELHSMASGSEQNGLASDLVRQVSSRLSGAATWLGDRDPASVLSEVKSYARRKPGTFILGAVIAGVVVGRLTRALASNASDDKAAADRTTPPRAVGAVPQREQWEAPVPAAPFEVGETPIFAQSAPAFADPSASEDRNVRPNSF